MVDVALDIVAVHRDPQVRERLRSGKYRINRELNEEWVDIQNNGPYVLNLQGRVLAAIRREGLRQAPQRFEILRHALLRANTTIPMQPGQKVRVYSGEQPRTATRISDQVKISRVLWIVQSAYMWVPECNEAHLYFSLEDMRKGRTPLARYFLS